VLNDAFDTCVDLDVELWDNIGESTTVSCQAKIKNRLVLGDIKQQGLYDNEGDALNELIVFARETQKEYSQPSVESEDPDLVFSIAWSQDDEVGPTIVNEPIGKDDEDCHSRYTLITPLTMAGCFMQVWDGND